MTEKKLKKPFFITLLDGFEYQKQAHTNWKCEAVVEKQKRKIIQLSHVLHDEISSDLIVFVRMSSCECMNVYVYTVHVIVFVCLILKSQQQLCSGTYLFSTLLTVVYVIVRPNVEMSNVRKRDRNMHTKTKQCVVFIEFKHFRYWQMKLKMNSWDERHSQCYLSIIIKWTHW